MQKLRILFFRLLLLFLFLNGWGTISLFGQATDTAQVKKDSSSKILQNTDTSQVKKDSSKATKTNSALIFHSDGIVIIHPVIRVGTGMLSYIGNVKAGIGTTNIQNPSNGRIGYDLSITQKISPVSELSLDFLYGSLGENERTTVLNWNFQSIIAGGGINFLFKVLPKQDVTPYAIIGIESYEYFSSVDIYDQYGNQYYNWSDGTLRSLPQSSPNAAAAKTLYLSYNYSTDIRSLNLDGSGKYTRQTFALPIGLGFMFRVGTRSNFMIGSTLHYAFTNHIDGLTSSVQGPLQGTMPHDMFLYSYVSLRFNLTRDHPSNKHRYDSAVFDPGPDFWIDTVHAEEPGNIDTSETALEKQYEMYMDSTGRFGQLQVDSFSWKVTNYIAPTNTNPSNIVIYKIQLFTTRIKLSEAITFAGINDKAYVSEENGTYVYTTRNFSSLYDAKKYLDKLKTIGYTGAFLRASKNGVDVPVQ